LLGTESSKPVLGLSGKVARKAIRIQNIRYIEWPFMDQNKPRAVLKDPLLKQFGIYSSTVETG